MSKEKMEKKSNNEDIKSKATRILTALVLVGIIILMIWAIPLAPKKDLLIVTEEMPKLDGSEGTSPAYGVYYVWDGKQEERPWWVIFQRPFEDGGFEWAVLEAADVHNVWDDEEFYTAMLAAAKFDEKWFKREMHRVQRTRFEKFRHLVFGTDRLEMEKKAIEQVLNTIDLKKSE